MIMRGLTSFPDEPSEGDPGAVGIVLHHQPFQLATLLPASPVMVVVVEMMVTCCDGMHRVGNGNFSADEPPDCIDCSQRSTITAATW